MNEKTVKVYYYDYEKLKLELLDNICTEKYTSFEQIDILKRTMEYFGNRVKGAHRDGYILTSNNSADNYNPMDNMIVVLQKVLNVRRIHNIMSKADHELIVSAGLDGLITEFSKVGLVNVFEFYQTKNIVNSFE